MTSPTKGRVDAEIAEIKSRYDIYSAEFFAFDIKALIKVQLDSLLAEAKPVIYPMNKPTEDDRLIPANEYPKAVPANIIKQRRDSI